MEGAYNDKSSYTSINHLEWNIIVEHGDIIYTDLYGLDICFDILINTSEWGHEIKWKIIGTKTMISCESNREYKNGQTYKQRCCLPTRETEFNLTCIDTFGDGWHGANLEIDGKKYCQNFKGNNMTVIVPNPAKKECEAGKNIKCIYICTIIQYLGVDKIN